MSTNYEKYLGTHAGIRLLSEHNLNEAGVWEILGEDPNCDLSGHHHQPQLAIVEGTLAQAIVCGVNLKGFWQWGAGGNFRKYKIPVPLKLTDNVLGDLSKLKERQKVLQNELDTIEAALNNAGIEI